MSDCIFCKIIKNEIPSYKIYEDDIMLAFLDINPTNHGHTLLISKEHYENMLKTPEEILQSMIVVAKKLAKKIVKAVNADGFNILVNNEETAGQIIFHTHWHIIPRFKNDGYSQWKGKKYQKGEAEEIAKRIKENL